VNLLQPLTDHNVDRGGAGVINSLDGCVRSGNPVSGCEIEPVWFGHRPGSLVGLRKISLGKQQRA